MAVKVFIIKKGHGDWVVKSAGKTKSASAHLTKEQAYARAKEIVANKGGGEIVIHSEGKIITSHTIKGA